MNKPVEILEPLNVLSLGGGVQSSVLALLKSKSPLGRPDLAIFADTGDEPKAVYRWIEWLKTQLSFPVITVHRGVRLSDAATTVRTSKKTGLNYTKPQLPAFTLYPEGDGRKPGKMPRHCSADFKIDLIKREAKKQAGKGRNIIMWLGISTDEPERMKPSKDPRIEHRYPLIELGMSREDCIKWALVNGYPEPPRSACIYCPFHSDEEWLRIKTETPDEFAFAVDVERRHQAALAQCSRIDSKPFFHPSRVPLDQVQFKSSDNRAAFRRQCPAEGLCGM